MKIPRRKLGQSLEVSALGLGCMGMSWIYGPADDKESLKVLVRAFEIGVNFWDTAEIYGPFLNEELLGKALKILPRDQIIVATKFAFTFNAKGEQIGLDSSPKHIKSTIEGSLKRLGTDYIDLYYQHRVDPRTPIEDTVGAMADLVKEGKIRHIGLSEASATTIRRAHKVLPISALQSEYSLWERGVEVSVLPTLKELGIGFVSYSPIGRGFLSGAIKKIEDLPRDDWRRSNPRFSSENFQFNFELVKEVQNLAEQVRATPSQVALAWLLKQGQNIVPIPGTKRISYLEENANAAFLNISEMQWAPFEAKLKNFRPYGDRYPKEMMKTLDKAES
jgi:aryl-alcohol dehydrogenase-like predicted oxidoreductase